MPKYIDAGAAEKVVMAANWENGADGARAMAIIATAPAVDVEPVKHGHIIKKTRRRGGMRLVTGEDISDGVVRTVRSWEQHEEDFFICPVCGKRMDGFWLHYCDNCGAKMDKEDKDNDK